MSENILEVRHLKKYFPTKRGLLHAVDDVNFSIKKELQWDWLGSLDVENQQLVV